MEVDRRNDLIVVLGAEIQVKTTDYVGTMQKNGITSRMVYYVMIYAYVCTVYFSLITCIYGAGVSRPCAPSYHRRFIARQTLNGMAVA